MSQSATDVDEAPSRVLAPLDAIRKLCFPQVDIPASPPTTTLQDEKGASVFYLAYGSNLSAETFLGKRGIKPLSQENVCVPELKLTFDLPGIAYIEPCFANSGWRNHHDSQSEAQSTDIAKKPRYHKDRWLKPLVGVLYELTPLDFAHVIATEGGGASYHDIIVDCYPLEPNATTVPETPTNEPIKGHTLFAPALPNPKPPNPPPTTAINPPTCVPNTATPTIQDINALDQRYSRPNPSYAQPSARYLKLITDGAREHALPHEYRDYIAQIRPYTPSSQKQRMGQFVFGSFWVPIIMLMFAISRRVANKEGKAPPWLVAVLGWIFASMWRSYDQLFRPVFGDGERTHHGEGDEDGLQEPLIVGEKQAYSDSV